MSTDIMAQSVADRTLVRSQTVNAIFEQKCQIIDRISKKNLLSLEQMQRSKLIAIITGAISIALAIVYLIIVQFLDFRGEMLPAPQSQILQPTVVANFPRCASEFLVMSFKF